MFEVVGCFWGMIQIETIVTYCDHMCVIVTRTWVPVLWTSAAAVVMGFLHRSWLQAYWVDVGGKSLHVIPCDHRKHVNRKVMWVCIFMFTCTLLCTYLFQALLSKSPKKRGSKNEGRKKNKNPSFFSWFSKLPGPSFWKRSVRQHIYIYIYNLDLLKVIILRILPW